MAFVLSVRDSDLGLWKFLLIQTSTKKTINLPHIVKRGSVTDRCERVDSVFGQQSVQVSRRATVVDHSPLFGTLTLMTTSCCRRC